MKLKVCPRCDGLGEEPASPIEDVLHAITLCSKCNGKGEVSAKTLKLKLAVETCSFIPITSVKALIKSKRALNEFDESLGNGSVSYGDGNRTMTTIDYILERIRDTIEYSANANSFNKAIAALEEARDNGANGVTYIDLEN